MKDNLEENNGGETAQEQVLEISQPLQLTAIAIALGIAFEVLFYSHPIGISFFLLSTLCGVGLLGASILEGHKPSWRDAFFFVPILFFSFMTYMRAEELTVFLNIVGTLILFALWVRDFKFQRFFDYGFLELGVSLVQVPVESLFRPWNTLGAAQRKVFKEGERRSVVLGVLRGLVLALPVLVILLVLLTSADLVFADRVRDALDWLDLERLAEYAGRTLFIVLGAIFTLGAIITALRVPDDRKLIGEEKPILKPFLGFIEAMVILGSVDLLFLSFLIVQLRYLFGGAANIDAAGYTFSEYARRGFFELVAVGILSSGLILALAWWARREGQSRRRWFNGLSALLVIQVGLILYSSLTRLFLYEEAYGFTRLRTYTHVFIPWMALVLAASLILLFRNKLNRFALAVVVGIIGFVGTLNLLNVDAFIVRQNVARLEQGGEIDLDYLVTLSVDAAPELVELAGQDLEDEDILLGELACWNVQLEDDLKAQSWPSSHQSRKAANDSFAQLEDSFKDYRVYQEDWGWWMVVIDGESRECGQQKWVRGFD